MSVSWGVADVTLAAPPRTGVLATKEMVTLPPSPRHVQVGGRRWTSLQTITPPAGASLQTPVELPRRRTIEAPAGGNHLNESIAPIPETFVTVNRYRCLIGELASSA